MDKSDRVERLPMRLTPERRAPAQKRACAWRARVAVGTFAASLSIGMVGCGTTGGGSNSVAGTLGDDTLEITDASEHFAGNHEFDGSGRSVARDDDSFRVGEFESGASGFEAGAYATKAYSSEGFSGTKAFDSGGRKDPVRGAERSSFQGKSASVRTANRGLSKRSELSDRDYATNPYERSEKLLATGPYEEAESAQAENNRLVDRILPDDRTSQAESDRSGGILPSIDDIRSLLGRDES